MKIRLSTAAILLALLLSGLNPGQAQAKLPAQTESYSITGRVALEAPQGRLAQVDLIGASYSASLEDHPGALLEFALPTAGEYELLASAACHLPAERASATASGDSYTVVLRAGDVDGDGRIADSDLALIGSLYGSRDVTGCANLDGDREGKVTILDLLLAARNYGQVGPTGWNN